MTDDPDDELYDEIAGLAHDPLGFALTAYDWGRGELKDSPGPRDWQRQELAALGKRLREQAGNERPIRKAIVSGNGIGKSAFISMLVDWAMSTMPDCKVVVTANTAPQLQTKTWPEIIKWHRMSITSAWFTANATSLVSNDGDHARTWTANAVTWSANNTEAFAGLHNKGKRILIIFDEASAIDDKVWDVTEGALTDAHTEIIWYVFGNYTRNIGRFDECFQGRRALWDGRQIDSRTVEGVSKELIEEWRSTYGEDSDFFCARVSALRPRFGTIQFISQSVVIKAQKTMACVFHDDPVILGVDVAEFGDDESVIFTRRGRDAKTVPPQRFKGIELMALVGHIVAHIEWLGGHVDAVFVDATGLGAGVASRLRELGYRCISIHNGEKSDCQTDEQCDSKGAECWSRAKSALKDGCALYDDQQLLNELSNRMYSFSSHGKVILERKKDMKKRGLASPNIADAFCLTYAYPVAPRVDGHARTVGGGRVISEYDPHSAAF